MDYASRNCRYTQSIFYSLTLRRVPPSNRPAVSYYTKQTASTGYSKLAEPILKRPRGKAPLKCSRIEMDDLSASSLSTASSGHPHARRRCFSVAAQMQRALQFPTQTSRPWRRRSTVMPTWLRRKPSCCRMHEPPLSSLGWSRLDRISATAQPFPPLPWVSVRARGCVNFWNPSTTN